MSLDDADESLDTLLAPGETEWVGLQGPGDGGLQGYLWRGRATSSGVYGIGRTLVCSGPAVQRDELLQRQIASLTMSCGSYLPAAMG